MAITDQSSGSLITPEEKKNLVRIRISGEEEEEFVISESGAALSATLKKMLEEGGAVDGVITLSNIRSRTLPMIISYLETHAAGGDCWDFDSEFASGKDHYFLKELMKNAHDLKIQNLVGLLAQKVVDWIRNKSMKYKHIVLRGKEPTTEQMEKWRRELTHTDWEEQRRLEERDEVEEELAKANLLANIP